MVHRDIRLQNVYIDNLGVVKIGGFEYAKETGPKPFNDKVGVIEYMAPEMLADGRRVRYGKEVDIWALGIMLFNMVHGSNPFETK